MNIRALFGAGDGLLGAVATLGAAGRFMMGRGRAAA